MPFGNLGSKVLCLLLLLFSQYAFSQNPIAGNQSFQILSEGNFTSTNSHHIHGPLAVGGNLVINSSFLGETNMDNTGSYVFMGDAAVPTGLLVKGSVTWTLGAMKVGDGNYIHVGNSTGSISSNNGGTGLTQVLPTGAAYNSAKRIEGSVNQPTNVFQTVDFDFTTLFNNYRSTSTTLSTKTNNVQLYNTSNVAISGNTVASAQSVRINSLNTGVNYLNLTTASLTNITELVFNDQPSISKVLIINVPITANYTWNNVNMTSLSGSANGAYVLWNFYGATTYNVTVNQAALIVGTVYAPNMNLIKTGTGDIDGNIIAKTVQLGTGEIHNYQFASDLQNFTTCSCNGNLLTNPGFETSDFTGWTLATNDAGHTSFAGDNSVAVCGTRYAYFNPTAGNATDFVSYYQNIPTTVGQVFNFSIYAGVHDASKDHQLRLQFFNSSNVLLAGGEIQQVDNNAASGLIKYSLTGTAPTGVAYVRVTAYASGAWSGTSVALKIDAACLTTTAASTCTNTNASFENGTFSSFTTTNANINGTLTTYGGSQAVFLSSDPGGATIADKPVTGFNINTGYWIDATTNGGLGAKDANRLFLIPSGTGANRCVFPNSGLGFTYTNNNCYRVCIWVAQFNPSSPNNASLTTQYNFEYDDAWGTTDPGTTSNYSITPTSISESGASNVISWTLPASTNVKTTTGVAYTGAVGQVVDWKTLNWQQICFNFTPAIDASRLTVYNSTASTNNGLALDGFCVSSSCVACSNVTAGGMVGSNQTFCVSGNPAAFTSSVAASGGSGTVVYQWEKSVDGGTTWVDIVGATSATYDEPNTISITTHYRRKAMNSTCITFGATSNTIIVTITPLNITATSNSPVCVGATIHFETNSTTSGVTYSWTGPNGFTSTNDQYPCVTNAQTVNGGVYTAKVTIGGCIATATVNVVINNTPAPSPPTVPIVYKCAAGTATFTASNCAGTVKWYSADWNFLASGSTFTTPSLSQNTQYLVECQTATCLSEKGIAYVIFQTTPTASISASSSTICSGQSTTLTATSNCSSLAPNLLVNSGFETGGIAPWWLSDNSTVVNNNANSGTYSNKVTGSAAGSVLHVYNLKPNTNYTLRAWMKAGSTGQIAYIYARGYGGTELRSANTTTTTYQQKTLTFTTGATDSYVEIGIWRDNSSGTGDVYTDDFDLEETNPTCTLSWSPGGATTSSITVSPTATTTYTLTSGLNGCTTTTPITINVTSTSGGSVTASSNSPVNAGGTINLTSTSTGSQLVTNGNFSSGNIGFSSDYTFGGGYNIASNPQTVWSWAVNCVNPSGNMMLGDGNGNANSRFWYQSINVTAGTTYTLSFRAYDFFGGTSAAKLQWGVNGTKTGTISNLATGGCNTWQQISTTWTATATGTAVFAIYNNEVSGANNDFAVDDISIIATAPFNYSWSGPLSFTSNTQNPTLSNATTSMSGVYTVTSSIGGCAATATTNVAVNSSSCTSTFTGLLINDMVGSSDIVLTNGTTYNINSFPSSWNLETTQTAAFGSVVFTITGSISATNTENTIPFNHPGSTAAAWGLGTYTINVKGYSGTGGTGTLCDEETIVITLSNSTFSCSGSCESANLVVNPQFETDMSGWTASNGQLTRGGGGTYGSFLEVNVGDLTGTYAAYQDVAFGANAPYKFTAYAAKHGVNNLPKMYLEFFNGTTYLSKTADILVTKNYDGTFQFISFEGNTPANTTKIRIVGWTQNNALKFDNLSLIGCQACFSIVPPASICVGQSATLTANNCSGTVTWNTGATGSTITVNPTTTTTYSATCGNTTNLLVNPSFETGSLSPWANWNNASITSIASEKQSGTFGAKVTATATAGGFAQDIAAVAGETFTLKAWGKVSSATPWSGLVFKFVNASWVALSEVNVDVNATSFQEYTLTNTAPAGTVWAQVYAWTEASTILYLDNFSFVKTSANSTATATVTVNAVPTATATGDTECVGATIVLGSTGGGSGTPLAYSWTGPASFASTLQNPTRASATTAMAGVYTVTVTSANGCTATATANVTVNNGTIPTATVVSTGCTGATGSISVTNLPDGFSTNINGGAWTQYKNSYVDLAAGTYTIGYQGGGCNTYANFTVVTSTDNPLLSLAKIDPTCTTTGSVTLTGSGGTTGLGDATYQLWYGIAGSLVSSLTSNANYPNTPSLSTLVGIAEGYENSMDNIGGRLSGYIVPPTTGTYYFWVASDDYSEFWGSGDANPANKTLLASVSGFTGYREWNKYTSQKTAAINLTAGQLYYFEVLYKEGTGGDNISLGWAKPGEATTAPSEVIPGKYLRPNVASSTTTPIYQYKIGGGAFQTGNVFTGLAAGTYTVTIQDAGGCTTTASITLSISGGTAAPTGTGASRCGTGTVAISASGCTGTYNWYAAAAGGTSLATGVTYNTTSISATTTYYVDCTVGSCVSSRTAVAATVNAVSSAPTATGASRCGTGTVTLSAAGCAGTNNWYNVASGGTSLSTASTYTTPSISATTTYYVDCTVGSCTSSRTSSVATVNAAISATASSNAPVCVGSAINLSATGGTSYLWNGPNSFTSAAQNPSLVATATTSGIYTVTVTGTGGCTATATTNVANPNITISNIVVSACINQPLQDVATVSMSIAWVNAPSGDKIKVVINNKTEYIDVAAGVTSPQTVTFIVPANGISNIPISAGWVTYQSGNCNTLASFNAPVACSVDNLNCEKILYLCGPDKPADGDAWDHGFMNYLTGQGATLTATYTKPDASGYGLYNPLNTSTLMSINLNDYTSIIISPTTEANLAANLLTALKGYSGGILMMNYTEADDLGLTSTPASYSWQDNAYTNNTNTIKIYNYDNINPTYGNVVTHGNYLATADAYLWTGANNMSSATNGIYFYYTPTDAMAGVPSTHGARVYLGYHMNGVYSNSQNGGTMPAPSSSYFSPTNHLTLEGKAYFDQAIKNITSGLTVQATGDTECAGSTINLTSTGVGIVSYSWTGPSSFTSTLQNPTRSSTTTAMSGIYTVTVTGAGGCIATATANVVVNAIPTAPTSAGASRCNTGAVTMTASGCAGGTITWYGALTGGTALTTGATYTTPSIAATTTYFIECSLNGCVSTTRNSAVATVNTIPTASATGDTECVGSTIVLASSGGNTYSWTGPSSYISTLQNPTISNATTAMAGVYTVTVTGTGGCTATATANVVVNTIPTAPTSAGVSRCGTGTVTLSASGCAGGTITWYGALTGGTALTTGATYATPSISSTTTYYLECSLNGCVSTTRNSAIATVNSVPIPTASTTGACVGGTIALSATGGNTYSWTGPIAFNSILQNPSRSSATTAMTGYYVVTVTSASGCTATANTYVQVSTISASVSNVLCNNNGTLSTSTDDYFTFLLTPSGSLGGRFTVSAVQAGSAISLTLSDGSATGNLSYAYPVPLRIPNGKAGAGNVTLTLTDVQNSSCSFNIVVTDPGTCNANNCTGTTQTVSYSYRIPLNTTELTQAPINLPKFDNAGGTRILTKVDLKYGMNEVTTAYIENQAASSSNLDITITGSESIQLGATTLKSLPINYTNSTTLPAQIIVPAQGNYAGDSAFVVFGSTKYSTLYRMNSWLSKVVDDIYSNPTADGRWVTNAAGNATYDDDIYIMPVQTFSFYDSTTYTTPTDLTQFIGTGNIGLTASTNNNANFTGGGGNFIYLQRTKAYAYATVTYSYVCCIAPTAVSASSNSAICSGQNITLTASSTGGSTYSWSGPNGFTSTSQNPTITGATTARSGIYTVTIVGVGTCTATATTNVVVNAIPIAPTSAGASRCNTGTVTMTASGCTGGIITWYGALTGGTALTTGATYTTPSISATTTYYLECSLNGCISTTRNSAIATVNSIPTATATANSPIIGGTLNLYATGGGTYSWTGPDGFTSTLKDVSIAPVTASMASAYTVTVNVNGCTATATTSVSLMTTEPGEINCSLIPTLSFTSPTLITGTAGAVNAQYRFSNVTGGTDAIVTIMSKSHPDIDIIDIDIPATTYGGYDAAMQPIIDYNWINGGGSFDAAGEKSVTFKIDFVETGTTTPKVMPNFIASGIDIDGSGLEVREFIESSGHQSHEVQTPTSLTLSGGLKAKGAYATYAGINELALDAVISYGYVGKSSITITYGAEWNGNTSDFGDNVNPTMSDERRLNSLYFKCYDLNTTVCDLVLAAPTGLPSSRCGTGTVTLSATGCSGTYNWYAAATGGTAIGTSNNYITPSISANTTYYVECNAVGCTSTRISVLATVNAIPVAPTVSSNSICGSGSITLTATGCTGGTISWFTSKTGGTSLGTGITYTAAALTSSAVYFAGCTSSNSCVSTSRNYGVATVNSIPEATLTGIGSLCLGYQPTNSGKLLLTKFKTTDTFSYNIGSTYNSGTASAFAAIPVNGEILTGISDPSTSITYTVRIKNAENCIIDRVVTLTNQCSTCPAGYCEPSVIVKTK